MILSDQDFDISWFSGTGKGGQHRNKHQNCCRVIHRDTGITANGTNSRSREQNKQNALAICRARVIQHFHVDTARYRADPERVRTYHEPDNRVVDHASGVTTTYKTAVLDGDLADLIQARALAKRQEKQAPVV
jgi:peptide chain release factor 1